MRARSAVKVMGVTVLLGAVISAGADTAQARKEIMAQYSKMTAAFKAKNLSALMAPTTSDLVVKLPGGQTLNRPRLEEEFKKQFAETRTVKEWTNDVVSLTVKGDTAIANVKSHLVAVVAFSDGRIHTLESSEEGKDTWVKTAAGWKLKIEQVTKTKTLMDGKPPK